MVEIWVAGYCYIPYEYKLFSGGETHVKIKQDVMYHSPSHIDLRVKLTSPEEVMKLLMLTAACREQWPDTPIHLIVPYLPFARQDRLCDRGEAFSLKVFTQLINAQNYATVTVYDCHSLVGLALLDRVIHIEQHEPMQSKMFEHYGCIVAPDLGAVKKAEKVVDKLHKPLVVATKQRDPASGRLSDPKIVNGFVAGNSCLIVDDICDGGATFINLAKVLYDKGAANVGLYVTHGIFSKDIDIIYRAGISEIFTTNSFTNLTEPLTVIDIFN